MTEGITNICRLCLKIMKDLDVISNSERDAIQIVIPQIDLEASGKATAVICKSCAKLLQHAFSFKSKCLEIEDDIHGYKKDDQDQVNLEKILGIENNSTEECIKICRTCLRYLENNAFTELVQENGLQFILRTFLPEMDIGLTIKPVVCRMCEETLNKIFNFVTLCLGSEEKIKFYLENINNGDDINLSHIVLHELNKDILADVKDNLMQTEEVTKFDLENNCNTENNIERPELQTSLTTVAAITENNESSVISGSKGDTSNIEITMATGSTSTSTTRKRRSTVETVQTSGEKLMHVTKKSRVTNDKRLDITKGTSLEKSTFKYCYIATNDVEAQQHILSCLHSRCVVKIQEKGDVVKKRTCEGTLNDNPLPQVNNKSSEIMTQETTQSTENEHSAKETTYSSYELRRLLQQTTATADMTEKETSVKGMTERENTRKLPETLSDANKAMSDIDKTGTNNLFNFPNGAGCRQLSIDDYCNRSATDTNAVLEAVLRRKADNGLVNEKEVELAFKNSMNMFWELIKETMEKPSVTVKENSTKSSKKRKKARKSAKTLNTTTIKSMSNTHEIVSENNTSHFTNKTDRRKLSVDGDCLVVENGSTSTVLKSAADASSELETVKMDRTVNNIHDTGSKNNTSNFTNKTDRRDSGVDGDCVILESESTSTILKTVADNANTQLEAVNIENLELRRNMGNDIVKEKEVVLAFKNNNMNHFWEMIKETTGKSIVPKKPNSIKDIKDKNETRKSTKTSKSNTSNIANKTDCRELRVNSGDCVIVENESASIILTNATHANGERDAVMTDNLELRTKMSNDLVKQKEVELAFKNTNMNLFWKSIKDTTGKPSVIKKNTNNRSNFTRETDGRPLSIDNCIIVENKSTSVVLKSAAGANAELEAVKIDKLELRRKTGNDLVKEIEVEQAIKNNNNSIFWGLTILVCNFCQFNSRTLLKMAVHCSTHLDNSKKIADYVGNYRPVFYCARCTKSYNTEQWLRSHLEKCPLIPNDKMFLFRVGKVMHCIKCYFDSDNKKLVLEHLLSCGNSTTTNSA